MERESAGFARILRSFTESHPARCPLINSPSKAYFLFAAWYCYWVLELRCIFLYSNSITLLLFCSNLSLYCYFGRDCPCVRILFKIGPVFCWKKTLRLEHCSIFLYGQDFFVLSGSLITLCLCSLPLSITIDNIQASIGIQKKNIQFAGWILSHYTVNFGILLRN